MMNTVDGKHLKASEKAEERILWDTRDELIKRLALIQKEVSDIQASIAEGEQALGLLKSEQLANEHCTQFSGHKGLCYIKERLEKIQTSLRRDRIKISVFGRTSTGKSAVINALLGDRILPSGLGHVTNCFIEICGTDENQAFLIENGRREDIKKLREKANAQSPGTKHAAHLEVHWPKTKCPLLKNDFVIIDSPGIDVDVELDKGITQYCADSDVFILVVNGEASMSMTETNFLKRIATEISIPNMCILVNRWDLCIEDENKELLKEQHRNKSQELFESVGKEMSNTQNVFFVSAKNTLEKGFDVDDKDGSANEFNMFKTKLLDCVCTSAVATKCQRHVKSWKEMCEQLAKLNEESHLWIQQGRTLTRRAQAITIKQLSDVREALSVLGRNTEEAIASLQRVITSLFMPLATTVDPRREVIRNSDTKFNGTAEEYKKSLHERLKNRIFLLAKDVYENNNTELLVTMSKKYIAGTAENILREQLVEQTRTLSKDDVDTNRLFGSFISNFSFKPNKTICALVGFVAFCSAAAASALAMPFIGIGYGVATAVTLGSGGVSAAATYGFQKFNWDEQAIIYKDFIKKARATIGHVIEDLCEATINRISKQLRDLRDALKKKLKSARTDLVTKKSNIEENVSKLDGLLQTTGTRRTTIANMMSDFCAWERTDFNV